MIVRGRNDDQLLPLAQLARQQGVELRLIEAMDVGTRNGWSPADVVPAAEMVHQVGQRWPLEPLCRTPHGTAQRWRYGDGQGVLGCLLLECEQGRLAVKAVGSFILACCGDTTVPFGLLKAKVIALHEHLLPSLASM